MHPTLRLTGWRSTRPIDVIILTRNCTGIDLAQAKHLIDRLMARQPVDIPMPNEEAAMQLATALLRDGHVAHAEFHPADGGPARAIPKPSPLPPEAARPPGPNLLCPACRTPLKDKSQCPHCDWLRFPGDRARWGTRGRCPRCGFAYRWDGQHCSHCGQGAVEVPPLVDTDANSD